MPFLADLADGVIDLFLGSHCVGCAAPGRPLCRACEQDLPTGASLRWPSPQPPGLSPPFAAATYDAAVRAMVLAHKERRVLALARPLGRLLAQAVRAALADLASPGSAVVLVPVPSRPAAVRQRGHDPTSSMTRVAARALAGDGHQISVQSLLRLRPGVLDQSGLDLDARAVNLSGAMSVPSAGLQRLARRLPRAHVVVCDDVITTGATLGEAQRALHAAGVPVLAEAVVAATRLRRNG